MRLATFTTGEPDPARDCYPLVRSHKGKLDVLKTVMKVANLEDGVPLLLEEEYLQRRDGLSLLIRLRLEASIPASRAPVYVRLRHPLEDHLRHHPKYAVLCTEGITLLTAGEEPDEEAAVETLTLEQHLRVLEALPIKPEKQIGRHGIANEWGPHRLAIGYQLVTKQRGYPKWVGQNWVKLRQRDYYAYLESLATLRAQLDSQGARLEKAGGEQVYEEYEESLAAYEGAPLRVLLLDDEIEAGWGDAVKDALEKPGTLTVDTSLAGVDFDAERERVAAKVEEGWDLILADLRTSAGDRIGVPTRGTSHYTGAEWIRRIKKQRPDTAVVAFTASNKAWSVEELRDLGVDGYWVKESPEFGVDDAYSAANAARLLTVVREALKPRIQARPVWNLWADFAGIQSSRSGAYTEGWATAMNRSVVDVTFRLEAIHERIRRAYGFMVLSRSKHAEEEFAMRRLDLAFLTLWSVINETVYLYFNDPRKDPSFTFKGQLHKVWDAEFSIRNPATREPLTYWYLKKGVEVIAPKEVPTSLVDAICPGSSRSGRDDKPSWPWGRSETAGVAWLLEMAGENDLSQRFDARLPDGRPGLRELRNKLEYEHGRLGDVEEASLEDIYDLCDVWRALLVTPYV